MNTEVKVKRIITEIIESDNFELTRDMINVDTGQVAYVNSLKMEGFKIIFSTGEYMYVIIDNSGQCCEIFGHICTEDDLSQFIGAEFLGYELVENDETLNKIRKDCQDRFELAGDYESTSVVFVNILTNKGDFQFVLYNHHNGYYGHYVFILFNGDIRHEERI